jgi:hypothetical protein
MSDFKACKSDIPARGTQPRLASGCLIVVLIQPDLDAKWQLSGIQKAERIRAFANNLE